MNFPSIQEPEGRVFTSLSEIDSDVSYKPGTLESEQANANLFEERPLFASNFSNAIKQVKKEGEYKRNQLLAQPGGSEQFPGVPYNPNMPEFIAQEEAHALATLGRTEGTWQNEKEIATAFRRQAARTKHAERKYEAVLDKAWGIYGEKLLEMDPDELADIIDTNNGFEDKTARHDFIRNATPFHDRVNISPYHALRNRLAKRLPDYQLGQTTFMEVKSSSSEKPFRFTLDEAGRRKFRAYSRYYDTQVEEALGGSASDIFLSVLEMIDNTFQAPIQTIAPDTIISQEWRDNPEKFARAWAAVTKLQGISSRVKGRASTLGQDAEKAVAIASQSTKFSNIPTSDLIISDPEAPIHQAFADESALIKEILELEKAGAFDKRSRLAPVIGLADSILYGTAGLASLPLYSQDPGSVVNIVQGSLDTLTSNDVEAARMNRVNEAISWQETMKDWQTTGMIFPMGNEWYASTPYMIKGPGEFIDATNVVGWAKWARHLKRTGMTRAAVETELLRNTARLRSLADTTFTLPPEIALQVDNVRRTITGPNGLTEYIGKDLTDWDVLDIISRGKGSITDIDAAGNSVVRSLGASDFTTLADKIDEFTASTVRSRARRQAGLANLARRNQGNVFSQFGSFVARGFPAELRGLQDHDLFKSVTKWFGSVRKFAQDNRSIGEIIVQEAPNKSVAFGAAKLSKAIAIGAGINIVSSGGESFTAGPGAYLATIYAMNDFFSIVEFAGNKGKFLGEYLEATRTGRQINGSVSAYKVNEKAAQIRRLKLELNQELTDAERTTRITEIDNLTKEITAWRDFSAAGWEKGLNFISQSSFQTLQGTATLDIMMEANDRSNNSAWALAGTMTLINGGWGSLYRNFNSSRIRKDQQRSVFAYNIVNADPVQAQRMLEGYKMWKEKGFGDEFIAWVNHTQLNNGNGQQTIMVTPGEMAVANSTISAADLLSNVETDQYQYRLNLIKEYQQMNPGSKIQDAEAYANDKINQLLSRNAASNVAVAEEKNFRKLQHQLGVLAGRLDSQTLELKAASDVMVQDLNSLGIPTTFLDANGNVNPTTFRAADFMTPAAFKQALEKQGIKWDPKDLFSDPDFFTKWNSFRSSFAEYAKLKTSYELGGIEFGKLQTQVEAARLKAAESADAAVNAGEERWRPGQSFTHTDYATGQVGHGMVVSNGIYIVDYARRENPDYDPNDPNSQRLVHHSVVMVDYTKFDPKTFHEEWAHKLFMAETFRDTRTLLYRDAIGKWVYDKDGNHVLESKGWAWETTVDENGKETHHFPQLRAFAESYASKLPADVAQAFMAEFDLSVERFNENPSLNYTMMMPVFNELFANAYAQRMLSIDTSSSKISSDPSSSSFGKEGSPMGTNNVGKLLWSKMFAGELTVSETFKMLQAIRSGNPTELSPEGRSFILGTVSQMARNEREGARVGAEFEKIELRVRKKQITKEEGEKLKEDILIKTGLSEVQAIIGQSRLGPSKTRLFGYEDDADVDAAFAARWGKGGDFDALIIKAAHERLAALGTSPELFGDGGWTTGVIFDSEGNPSVMPKGMNSLVDIIRYQTRTRVGTPDRTLMGDIQFWNDDGTFSPEKAQGVDLVMWAAYNGKQHWLDPQSKSRLKPLQTIIKESNDVTNSFKRLLKAEQAAGRASGINITESDDGFSISGRFTAEDVTRFKQVLKSSNFMPSEARNLMQIVEALSDVHMQEVPAFVINYKSMQYASVNSPKVLTRRGGYNSTRGMIPISVFVRQTKEGFYGDKLPDNLSMDMFYVRSVDIDALGRRQILAWNGNLLDDKDVPIASRDEVHAVFNGNAKLFRGAILDYLSLLSSGGNIGATKTSTKYPIMRSVDMFRELIITNPERYGLNDAGATPEAVRALAEKMARIVHGTIGAPNIAALMKKEKKAGKVIEEDGFDLMDGDELDEVIEAQLNDNEKGRLRIFRGERSIKSPSWGMRDKNFLITDFRLDRIINMRQTDRRIPWAPNSYFWNQVAYGARSPNAWVSVRKGVKPITGVGLHISDIVEASAEEGQKLRDLGVSDVYEHGSGYKIVLAGSGMFRVYDNGGRYVGEERTLPRAKDAAVKHGYTSPISTRHEFDKVMVGLGFAPQGIQYIVPKGSFIRRSRYISQDGKFQVRFEGDSASIYELSSRSAQVSGPRLLAKNIVIERDGKGGFDLAELQEAVKFTSDEMNQSSVVSYDVVDELTGKSQTVEATKLEQREVYENVDPDLLEFMPQMIGRSVKGQRVFAKTNPAYYAFKRRLIDYIGNYKKANEVIAQMKKDLGQDVVDSDAGAVANWVNNYIKTKQDELDLIAETARKKQEAKENARVQNSILNPIAEIFAGAEQQRAPVGLPEITISPEDARTRLLADVDKFSRLAVASQQTPISGAAADPRFQTADAQARNRLLVSLNKASTEAAAARQDIGAVVNQLWVNAAGYTLSLELLPDVPVIGGFSFTTTGIGKMVPRVPEGVSEALTKGLPGRERPELGPGSGRTNYGYGKNNEPNISRYRWVVYTPAGFMVGQFDDKEKAFKAMLEADEREKKRALEEGRRRRNVSR